MTYSVAGIGDITSTSIKYGNTTKNNFTTSIVDNVATITYSVNNNYNTGEHTITFTDSEGQTATAVLNLIAPLSVSCVAIPYGSSANASISGAVGTVTATTETAGITTRTISSSQMQISVDSSVPVGTYPIVFTDDNQSATLTLTVKYPNMTVSTTSGTCTRGGTLTVAIANAVGAITANLSDSASSEGYVTLDVDDTTDIVTINISSDLPADVEYFTVQYTDSRDNALTNGGNGYKRYNLVS